MAQIFELKCMAVHQLKKLTFHNNTFINSAINNETILDRGLTDCIRYSQIQFKKYIFLYVASIVK